MLDIVKAALDEWGLRYEEPKVNTPTNPIIEFGMNGVYASYRAILSMDLADEVFGVYYICPLKVVEHRRKELARYFAGANYKVMLGHFDLDFRDGEVRFKVSVIVKGSTLSSEMVKQMIGISMKSMDRYFPGMMACEFGGVSAEEALVMIEQPAAPQTESGQ